MIREYRVLLLIVFCFCCTKLYAQQAFRRDISLNESWHSTTDDANINAYKGFENAAYPTKNWKKVTVPHNWDQYEGYQRKLHGNKHGFAWYRRKFSGPKSSPGKRYFLFFEGIGSYATVWLNGKKVGFHAGGRTTFTLDVTAEIKLNSQENVLAIRADHPANIQDLPWVDGGCSTERGFSEGSQPMGIFRPVHLIITSSVRVEPFGIHSWNDNQISEKSAELNINTTVKNYSDRKKFITIKNELLDREGKLVLVLRQQVTLLAGQQKEIHQETGKIDHPHLWSLEDPYLYQWKTTVVDGNLPVDEIFTPYGIRWISWPIGEQASQKRFLLNGKPVFINGIAEYEHLIGQSHAFTHAQIEARVKQVKAAGFNAFRDAHQPHNLLYSDSWDREGILCWTQMAAHIWYDTPAFRKNFKTLLTDWVKERRNSPAVVLWGLENESTLPEDFARECTELIRKLDPTASSQRKVTTCNGGKGTDWDVPQNWTGTYGGDPQTYGEDLKRQVLVGEYGAWRTIDLHQTDSAGKVFTENKMTDLMETKVRLAEKAKTETAGHFFWLYNSHDNPGRVQGGEGLRDLDRVGPVNYKGMFTPWEEPTDVFYMFRSNYAPKTTDPMVYIVSHTWPNRWTNPGIKDSIVVYSNCDEVELFNDVDGVSLGRKKRGEIGTHFQWNKPDIKYNVLFAIGYVNGKKVAEDKIILNSLPKSPNFANLFAGDGDILKAEKGYQYLYRLNCGGADYKDKYGNIWLADQPSENKPEFYGSTSWTEKFPGIPAFFASQRRTFSPVKGTRDWKLFQSFRYGLNQLKFSFPIVKDGEYLVELYFIEPWLGIGGTRDARNMRLFDVAINDKTVLKNIDIWAAVGTNTAFKKTVKVHAKAGQLTVSFPHVNVGQAVISAIAIASADQSIKPEIKRNSVFELLGAKNYKAKQWLDIGDYQYTSDRVEFTELPPNLFGAEWVQKTDSRSDLACTFRIHSEADVFVAAKPEYSGLAGYENTNTFIRNSLNQHFAVYRKRFKKDEKVEMNGGFEMLAIAPPSELPPAYDLKTVKSYKAIEAALLGHYTVKEKLQDKERVMFKAENDVALEWTIGVGVADTYSLTIKYHNPHDVSLSGKLEFRSADGTLMKTEKLEFAPTKVGKWNYINTNTGSMINAGSYKVKIIGINSKDLALDALDVQ